MKVIKYTFINKEIAWNVVVELDPDHKNLLAGINHCLANNPKWKVEGDNHFIEHIFTTTMMELVYIVFTLALFKYILIDVIDEFGKSDKWPGPLDGSWGVKLISFDQICNDAAMWVIFDANANGINYKYDISRVRVERTENDPGSSSE